jgi:hypothetical protein
VLQDQERARRAVAAAGHGDGEVAARAEAGRRGARGRRPEKRGYGGSRPGGAAWELPEAGGGAGRAAAVVSGGGL